jgi:hypothetical protein
MSEGRKVVLDVSEVRDPLARLAQEERQRQGDHHPPAEQLTAYHAGELADDEAERLQDHLAVCRICTQALLDLPGFYLEGQTPVLSAPSEALGPPSPAQTEASWRAVQARLAAWEQRGRGAQSPPPVFHQERRRYPRFITSPAAFLGMALSLLSCLVGFPVWIATHPPEVGLAVVVYLPPAEVHRGPGNEKELEIELPGRHGGSLTVVCPVPVPGFASYKVEIQDLHGKGPLVSAAALPQVGAASHEPSLTVKFPAERLAPGDYRLVVGSPRGEPLAEWPLRLHAPGKRL